MTVNGYIANFNKKHPNIYLHASTMPSCCSGLMVGGFFHLPKKDVPDAVEFLNGIADAAKKSGQYALLFAVMLMPKGGEWAEALKEAGWEMSEQVAKSNSYSGAVPMRVFIKSLRPMTKVEAAKKTAEAKKLQAQRLKRGYEW